MERLTYNDFIKFESNAVKEEYYYSHTFRRDEDRENALEYYRDVLGRIRRIKELALKKYLKENYLTLNDLRFTPTCREVDTLPF